jgi:hypothetical protein
VNPEILKDHAGHQVELSAQVSGAASSDFPQRPGAWRLPSAGPENTEKSGPIADPSCAL